MDARIAVLASGNGTNLQALLDDSVTGPWIALVLSDRPDARASERARSAGVKSVFVDPGRGSSREEFDQALLGVLEKENIEFLVLAGYMRLLGPRVVSAYENRCLNVHPSLLPAFPGDASVTEALAWGSKLTGVTVHFVDEKIDHGPIVSQEPVPVSPDDDWDSLEERIHAAEHRQLPAAVRALVEGRLKIEGRVVRVLGEESK